MAEIMMWWILILYRASIVMKYYSEFLPYTFFAIALVGIYFLLERKLTQPWMRWVFWIVGMSVVLATSWQVGTDHTWADFGKGYYFAGRKILRNPAQLYNGGNCEGFVNIPLLAYLFAPFSYLTKAEAGRIFFLINAASLVPLAYWLVRFGNLTGWRRWAILFLLLINGPLDYSIWLGNSTSLVMLGTVLALWWFQRGKEWRTGALLGINSLVKIPLILPSLYFLVRKQWKVVGGAAMVVGLAAALSFFFIPASLNQEWFSACILSLSGEPIAAYNNQSVVGLLSRELIPGVRLDYWFPVAPSPIFRMASRSAMVVLFVPVIIILLYRWRVPRTKTIYLLEYFIVLACSILASPIAWTHYFMMIWFPQRTFWMQVKI
jgi:hypothetical protein